MRHELPVVFMPTTPTPSFLHLPTAHTELEESLDVVLFGVPHDTGVEGRSGVFAGPDAVRRASWTFGSYNHALGVDVLAELQVVDGGDIGRREAPFEREALLDAIAEKTRQLSSGGQTPGLIGGSQLITLGALRGLNQAKRRPVSLLHLTAKNRCREEDLLEGGTLSHAMSESLLRKGGVLQVGVRGPSRDGLESSRALSFGFERLTMDDVRWDIHGSMETVRRWAGQGSLYISIDLSAFDHGACPGVVRPAPGGLSCWEAQQVLRALLGADIIGFDVVGLCPEADVSQITAISAVSLLHELLAVIAEGRTGSRISEMPGGHGRTSA